MSAATDAQKLIDAAVTTLKQTTVGYAGHGAAWQANKTTKWWQGLDKLAQARATLDSPSPPPPTPVGGVIELDGSISAADFTNLIAGNGPLTVRQKPSGKTAVVFGDAPPRNGVTCEDILFDGQGKTDKISLYDVAGFTYRRCRFRNYCWVGSPEHCQALFIGGGCRDGLLDVCAFEYTGGYALKPPGDYTGTAHVFFTWWSPSAPSDQGRYPRNIVAQGCDFGLTHGAYFAVQIRGEIPLSSGIKIAPGQRCDPAIELCLPATFVRA